MIKRFILYVVITMFAGTCKATDELSSEALSILLFSAVEKHAVGVVEILLVQDKIMRQSRRENRHKELKQISLPADLIKYLILPHDSDSSPRLIDMQNESGETVLQTIPVQFVMKPSQLNKRIKVSNLLKKFTNDPEYK